MRNLIVDPDFRDKIPGLSEDEFQKLEQNILDDGEVREPLVVWGETIVDGHHRNDIIRDAQVDRSSGARKYAVQILLAYNHGAREDSRLPNLL